MNFVTSVYNLGSDDLQKLGPELFWCQAASSSLGQVIDWALHSAAGHILTGFPYAFLQATPTYVEAREKPKTVQHGQ